MEFHRLLQNNIYETCVESKQEDGDGNGSVTSILNRVCNSISVTHIEELRPSPQNQRVVFIVITTALTKVGSREMVRSEVSY